MKSGSAVYLVSGRAVYRHVSDKGSVMQWVDKSNVVHKTLVLNAVYRSLSVPYPGAVEGVTTYVYGAGYMPNCTSSTTTATVACTDAELNSSSLVYDAGSSKLNTDAEVTAYAQDCASHWCRNNGSGISADLPNIQTLMRIYCCAEKIDLLDPTASTSGYKLSGWSFEGTSLDVMWSSSRGPDYEYWSWVVNSTGLVEGGSHFFGSLHVMLNGVIPTLDL